MAFAAPVVAFVSSYGGYIASAAAIVSSISKARQQQKQEKAYNKQLLQSTIDQYQQLDKAEADALYDSHSKSLKAQKELMIARAKIENQAAITGTQGRSVQVAINNLQQGFDDQIGIIAQEQKSRFYDVNQQARNIAAGYASRRSMSAPSTFGMLTNAAISGVSAYSAGKEVGKGFGDAYFSIQKAKTVSGPLRTGLGGR